MSSLLYIRLIGYTAGTLLQLFWMVVILGYRRQRNFERLFFFLCLALFFFYAGSLLALNAQIHYLVPPGALQVFAGTLIYAGLIFVPSLLVHMHYEYADTRGLLRSKDTKRLILAAAYAPAIFLGLRVYHALTDATQLSLLAPGQMLGLSYGGWLALAFLLSSWWQARFSKEAPDAPQRTFHKLLGYFFLLTSALVAVLHYRLLHSGPAETEGLSTALSLLALIPFVVLIWMVQKFNFLNIGRQKNLVYAVSATFLALLYLSLVRKASAWLEPTLPPEATAAILLFLLVVFVEPMQRLLGRRLKETAQLELDRVQKLMVEIQDEARQGDIAKLLQFIERRVKEQLELRLTRLELENSRVSRQSEQGSKEPRAALAFDTREFPILQSGRAIGVLHAEPHGAIISGDTRAALQFLCEQLPGALELCRLIEEKLRLERELAERERLALLGQMAASISHNLKNPLGSIKTILQIQMENPELPEIFRRETGIVLDEISRLSAKLNQLLQFSRPAVRGGSGAASCDPRTVVEEVAGVLRHEAERRGIALEVKAENETVRVAASAEAVNDIVSNLMVNALEATPRGGHVLVRAAAENATCSFTIEDDGPGIPAASREKILQPFFTTKAQGTGLGLAIVARRVAEFSGRLEWRSPVVNGHGTRFRVTLPAEEKEGSREAER
jgi:signal transduction histidine kinase